MKLDFDMAVAYGALTTLVIAFAVLFWLITADDDPVQQRASRLGGLAGVMAAGLLVALELALSYLVDPLIGGFLVFPTVVGGLLSVWLVGRAVYKAVGGGGKEERYQQAIAVEPATREHQGDIWCRLRELAHFRETLDGELINLVTGDRVSWAQFEGERCLVFKIAGKTEISGVRYETLTKYLAVQTGLAMSLGLATPQAAQTPPCEGAGT